MTLGFVISSSQAEINWNAFRLANLALGKTILFPSLKIGIV